MSATAGQADGVTNMVDKLGIEASSVVMEIGYDSDVDEELRAAVEARCGEIVDENTDEVVDVVLLWWREDDGDLVEILMDARSPLADTGVIWLLSPKPGRDGHIEPSEISEAVLTVGFQQTSSINAARDWSGARLVTPKAGRGKR